jgi:hypothetical protein
MPISRFVGCFLLFSCLLAARPLVAQQWEDYDYENLEFRGLGLEMGWVSPSRVDNALSLGLRADLGYLGPYLRIRPGIAYWSSQMRQQEIDRLALQLQNVCLRQRGSVVECPQLDLGRIRMSDLMINLDAQVEWTDTPLLFVPYAGLGGGLHLLNGRGEAINGTFIEDFLDAISPSLNLLTGLRVPLTQTLELGGEGRYVLSSDIRQWSLSAGAIVLFPVRGPAPPRAARVRP